MTVSTPARPRTRPSLGREGVLALLLLAEVTVLSRFSDVFLTTGSLLNTSRFFVESGLIALGMTLVIVTGGIDLSVGSAVALVSVTVGFSSAAGMPLPAAIVLGLGVGVLLGVFNGLLITALDLNPLVVTLGTLALYRGLAYAITDAGAVSDFPEWFRYFGQYYLGPVPGQLLVFALAAVAMAVVLARTRFGRHVYAIGIAPETSRFSGVPVTRVRLAVYALTGLLVAIAAVIYTSRVSTARGNAGLGMELTVITAVVLGGADIRGGAGTIAGTVLGVLVVAVLQSGLLLAGAPSAWVVIAVGAVLIGGVFLNEFFRTEQE